MIDIHFEINGRRVNPNQIGNALEQAVFKTVSDSIRQKVGQARCPEHGSAPSIVMRGRDLNSLQATVSGCCDKLIEAVKAKLA